MVAGGRSGQRGNDHRKTVLNGQAPRRGARRSPYLPNPGPLDPPQRQVWHPCRGAAHLLRRCPEVAAPKPPATSGYPLATLRVDPSRMSKLQTSGKAGGLKWGMAQSHAELGRWPDVKPQANNVCRASVPFPLTPALSLGEKKAAQKITKGTKNFVTFAAFC